MRLLLDTHILIWALGEPKRLPKEVRVALESSANEVMFSAASIWEIAIKVGLEKLTLSLPYRDWMEQAIADLGLVVLPITVEAAGLQAGLPWHHRDPFDRLIIAQALVENIPVVSIDRIFDDYGIERLWNSV